MLHGLIINKNHEGGLGVHFCGAHGLGLGDPEELFPKPSVGLLGGCTSPAPGGGRDGLVGPGVSVFRAPTKGPVPFFLGGTQRCGRSVGGVI